MSKVHVQILGFRAVAATLLGLVVVASGCGDGQFAVRPAKGKVVCGGQPVTSGSVTFAPIGDTEGGLAGKAATAAVGPDGTFVLTTHKQFDGAVVGKHRVQYVPDEEGAEEEVNESGEEVTATPQQIRERQAKRKGRCVQEGELTLEVKADGENDFTIELVHSDAVSED